MTKLNFKILLSIGIVLLTFAGCSKEEEEPIPTNTDLLTKEWNVLSIDGETEGFGSISLKFEKSGMLVIEVTDDDGEPFSQTVQWEWGTNETTIEVLFLGEELIWVVDKLTADAFWFYDEEESFFKLEPKM